MLGSKDKLRTLEILLEQEQCNRKTPIDSAQLLMGHFLLRPKLRDDFTEDRQKNLHLNSS